MKRTTLTSDDGLVSGVLVEPESADDRLPFLACIHGGGCNGRYFDLKGSSLAKAAHGRGFTTLLLNRPGYGGNRALPGPFPIMETAPLIREFIERCRSEHAPNSIGAALIGHSIGGAIALTIAAERGDWPMRSVAVSGIGDQSPPHFRSLSGAEGETIEPPSELGDALFFDPERSLKWQPLASLRAAAEPWLVSELNEVLDRWPFEWREVAARIDIPVHFRLAEHERVWIGGPAVVQRMAAAFERSPRVDAAILPGGGHLFEASRGGPEFIAGQLDFIAASAGRG